MVPPKDFRQLPTSSADAQREGRMGFRQAPGTVRCDQRNWRAMLYLRMRDCSVVRFSPRRAAAPSGPPTWPFASSSAL